MKEYLYAYLAVSLAAAMAGLLSPTGEKGGLLKHVRLLSSLLLICVLILPIRAGISYLFALQEGEIDLPQWIESPNREEQQEALQENLDLLSREYFAKALTERLEESFSISTGEVRCIVKWENDSPVLITVVLSGNAIWKDPEAIENFVSGLVGCECRSAIE